jgi:hypothetical protein
MKAEFERLSKKLNAYHSFSSNYCSGSIGSKITVDKHELIIPFKGKNILLTYEFGNHNVGQIVYQPRENSGIPVFSIGKRKMLSQLFIKNKHVLIVKSDDNDFKAFLTHQMLTLGIENIAKNSLFEPEILYTHKYTLKANYSLSFDKKVDVIEPMVSLFKNIIEWSHVAYLNSNDLKTSF